MPSPKIKQTVPDPHLALQGADLSPSGLESPAQASAEPVPAEGPAEGLTKPVKLPKRVQRYLQDPDLREAERDEVMDRIRDSPGLCGVSRWYLKEKLEELIGETYLVVVEEGSEESALYKSNFEAIIRDFTEWFPGDVEVFNGWIIVRGLDEQGKVTAAGAEAVSVLGELKDYPIYDEEHFSETEHEMSFKHTLNALRSLVRGRSDEVESRSAGAVIATLMEGGAVELSCLGQDFGWSRVYYSIDLAKAAVENHGKCEEWDSFMRGWESDQVQSLLRAIEELRSSVPIAIGAMPPMDSKVVIDYGNEYAANSDPSETLGVSAIRFLRSGQVILDTDAGEVFGGGPEECADWFANWTDGHRSSSDIKRRILQTAEAVRSEISPSPLVLKSGDKVEPGDQVLVLDREIGKQIERGTYLGSLLEPDMIADMLREGYVWVAIRPGDPGQPEGGAVWAKSTQLELAAKESQ